MGYDNPDFTTRRTAVHNLVAGANGTKGVFFSYQKFKLVAAHFRNTVAGTTSGAAAGYTVRNGTTSIGACVFSTSAIATQSSVDCGDTTFNSLDILNCLGGADATLVADVAYEYQILPDAAYSS